MIQKYTENVAKNIYFFLTLHLLASIYLQCFRSFFQRMCYVVYVFFAGK